MRKIVLLQWVANYDDQKNQQKETQLFQRDDPRIDLLKQFLKTERIKQLNDQDEIFFQDFFEFLDVNQRSLFNKKFFEKPSMSVELFRQFVKSR